MELLVYLAWVRNWHCVFSKYPVILFLSSSLLSSDVTVYFSISFMHNIDAFITKNQDIFIRQYKIDLLLLTWFTPFGLGVDLFLITLKSTHLWLNDHSITFWIYLICWTCISFPCATSRMSFISHYCFSFFPTKMLIFYHGILWSHQA